MTNATPPDITTNGSPYDQAPLVLEMRGIRKVFPGVVALDDVDFDVRPGKVHALLGENGAGKSTLIKIIAGVYRRDGGTMRIDGAEVDFKDPADALAQRIKVVYQELDLVDGLSVAENVFLGDYPKPPRGLVDFPAWVEGREVELCWKHDEPRIEDWHELYAGFAGRQPISTLPAQAIYEDQRIAAG